MSKTSLRSPSAIAVAFAAGLAVAATAIADPMETKTFAGPFNVYPSGNEANPAFLTPFSAEGYAAGGVRIVMDMTALITGTLASDVTVSVMPPGGPIFSFDVSMGEFEPFTTLTDVTRIVPLQAGLNPAGTWTFVIADSSAQGNGTEAEVAVSNVRLSIESASTPEVVHDIGPLPAGETVLADRFLGAGAVNWFKFVAPAIDDIAAPKYLDIITSGPFVDSYMGLYDNNGRLRAVDDDSGTSRSSFLSFGYGGGPTVGGGGVSDAAAYSDGRSGKLAAGTHWLAVSEFGGGPPQFNPGWNVVPPPEGSGFSYTLTFSLGTTPGGGTAPGATAVGTLVYPAAAGTENTATGSEIVSASAASWLMFTTAAVGEGGGAGGGTYLDITTDAASELADPEIGLYSSTGVLAGIDDDDGPDFAPFLSFGAGGGTTTGEFNGFNTVSDGRDGDLTAGTYYLAIGEFNSTFRNAFNVTVSFGGEGGGGGVAGVRFLTGRTVAACGQADVGGQGGVAGFDGVLDNNDFVVFIDMFFAHAPGADVGGQGGVPGADGSWDNNDFVVFIDLFFTGC